MTRPCEAVLVIFNTFPCSGITGGVQLEGGALFFNPYKWRSNRGFTDGYGTYTVTVGVANTINFNYTITLSTCPIYVGFRPTVLVSI